MIPARMDEHEAYTNLIEALKVAEAAARQLAFMSHGNVGHESKTASWMKAANAFGLLRDKCTVIATARIAH